MAQWVTPQAARKFQLTAKSDATATGHCVKSM